MIDIEMKMFFTKEHNQITVSYAKQIALKKLFYKIAFDTFEFSSDHRKHKVSDLIFRLAYYKDSFSSLPSNIALEIIELIDSYLNYIDRKDLTALYFLVFNDKQDRYLADFELNHFDETKTQDLLEQFGRFMARGIYEPEENFLDNDLQIYLQDLILSFSEDFGHTEEYEDSTEKAIEKIDLYTNGLTRVLTFL